MDSFDDLRRAMELYEACPHAPGECEACDEYRELCIRHAPALLAALSAKDERIASAKAVIKKAWDLIAGLRSRLRRAPIRLCVGVGEGASMSRCKVDGPWRPCDGCGTTGTAAYVQRGPVWLCDKCDEELGYATAIEAWNEEIERRKAAEGERDEARDSIDKWRARCETHMEQRDRLADDIDRLRSAWRLYKHHYEHHGGGDRRTGLAWDLVNRAALSSGAAGEEEKT